MQSVERAEGLRWSRRILGGRTAHRSESLRLVFAPRSETDVEAFEDALTKRETAFRVLPLTETVFCRPALP